MLMHSRDGEEPAANPVFSVPLVWFGLISWEELRMRAISSSARPRLIRGGSMSRSEVKIWLALFGRIADDSKDEK